MAMCDVVFWWMVFGVVIGQVVAALIPEDSELVLRFLTFEPVKAHLEQFNASCYDGVVYVSNDC